MEPGLMQPVIRRMLPEDLPAAMEIDAVSLARPWRREIWREELKSPSSTYLVVEEDGEILAQVGVKRVADELHVMTLAVRPEYRRRGYARALLEDALAFHPDAIRVYLEVRPSNNAARTLYDSLGFATTGLRRRYYGDEDALLMTLDL